VIDKYLRVSDVSLWVAVRQYVFSSRRYELAQSISAAEWGSLLERCQVTAGSSRGIRCLWYRCCWIPWTAHLPLLPRTARCSDPPTRPRIAIPLHRRMVAYKARRLVAWRKSCCCRCWSSWPRTPASWPRKAIPWPCRVLRPGPGGVQDPLEPPGRDNSGPSWPRKSRANRKQRSRSRVEPGVSLYTVYSARLSLVIFLFSILSSPTAQRSNVERYAGDNASIAFIRWDKINSVPAGRHILDSLVRFSAVDPRFIRWDQSVFISPCLFDLFQLYWLQIVHEQQSNRLSKRFTKRIEIHRLDSLTFGMRT